MLNRVVMAVLLCGVALTGCSAVNSQPQEPAGADRAHALWAHRTAYVGDNSKVLELIDESGFRSMGDMTVALQTKAVPYGVTISYTSVGKPFDTVDFDPQATLLLGLVGNLEQVDVLAGASSYTYTRRDVTEQLGFDVKALGQDEEKLRDYLASLED